MSKSLRTPEQRALQRLLTEARIAAGLTQAQLASRLGRPQSFVAKYEIGERKLDLVEFYAVARALECQPTDLFRAFAELTSP